MNKYDLYIGLSLYCCTNGRYYEVVSDIYTKDDEEYVDMRDEETNEIKSVDVDFLNEYCRY